MATTTGEDLALAQVEDVDLLKVTSYDRVASLVIAQLLFLEAERASPICP